LVSSPLLGQRQTGAISGLITDEQGSPLPGVEVTVSSPVLMGTRSFVTLADGGFRFPAVPPGTYKVVAKLTGFEAIERPDVMVSVGTTVTVNFQMKPAAQEVEVVVTAPTPTVDTKSSKLTTVYTSDLMTNIPLGRDVYYVALTAPGTIGDVSAMVSVHGSVLMQSRYVLDGVDITDPLRGYRASSLTFDAVEEVEMVNGGQSAENAKSSAAFINVVTKSGGNTLSGGLTVAYTSEDLFSSAFGDETLQALHMGTPIFDKYNYDVSLSLGGRIIKDRLWYFLNPRYVTWERNANFVPFTAGNGIAFGPYTNKRKDWLGFGKVTAQITNSLKFMTMYHGYDGWEKPYSWWNMPHRAPSYTQELKYTPWTLSSVLSYVIDPNTFADLKVGYVRIGQQNLDLYELGEWPLEMYAYDRYYGTEWGLIPWNEDYDRKKLDVDFTLTRFLDDFLGANHELKVGAGYTYWWTRTSYFSAANYETYWYKGTPWNYADVAPYVGDVWISSYNEQRDSIGPQLAEAQRYGVFVQDVVSVGKRLTLNLGLRYDRVAMTRPEEVRLGWFDEWGNGLAQYLAPDIFPTEDLVAPEIKNAFIWAKLQPRLGLSYDPFGDGKTVLRLNWARMTDDIVGDMTAGLHPFDPWENGVYAYWFDLNMDGVRELPPTDAYQVISRPAKLNTDPAQISSFLDRDMSSPWVDELTAGITRELVRDFSLGLTYIYRVNKNIADTLDTNNPLDSANWLAYTVTEPGPDAALGTGDDASITVYGLKADAPYTQRFRTNVEFIERKYQGIELAANKRMSNGWQLAGSITYSKTYGNIGGDWGIWRGDRGGFLNPNQLVNRLGRTNYDRPLIIKLMGTAVLPFNIVLSAFYSHYDGSPTNRTITVYLPEVINGVINRNPDATVNAEAPGTIRNPASDNLDLRLEKVFNLPVGKLGIYVDAFNILGLKQLYVNLNNGGYIYPDGSFVRYPTYGQINSATGVRSFKFTLRYYF
jgi:outer membrane receptor protein involved in Fe transport